MVASWNSYPNMFVKVARDYASNTDAQYINGYVTDTIALNRLTLTGGLRVDHQVSSLEAAAVPAVAGFANLLPAISTSAASGVFVWNSFTPRVGFTLAIDEARKAIVRGSYAMLRRSYRPRRRRSPRRFSMPTRTTTPSTATKTASRS